jgi:molybdate transport system substrate-binding protein
MSTDSTDVVAQRTVDPPAALDGISSMAVRNAVTELAASYAAACGQPVHLRAMGGVDAMERVQKGEACDFIVLAASAVDELMAAGLLHDGSKVDVATSRIEVAVAAGAPHPDIGSEARLRDAILAARTIGFSTGPSGVHLLRLFTRWGVADALASRLVQAPPGHPVGALVASGQAEIGFQQSSELVEVRGIDIVGPMPAGAQEVTTWSAVVCRVSPRGDAARAFLGYLASPQAAATWPRHGMEPAR